MVFLGLELWVAGWQIQANPLSYGGNTRPPLVLISVFSNSINEPSGIRH